MTSQIKCTLLNKLPTELRQEVYYEALASDDYVINAHIPGSGRSKPVLGLGLLATCRALHNEVDVRIFYDSNRFMFTTPNAAARFFSDLRKTRKAHLIKEISFDVSNSLTPTLQPPGIVYQRGFRYTEWAHYLECNRPVEDREGPPTCSIEHDENLAQTSPLCYLNDDLHFHDDLPSLWDICVVAIDLVGLQRIGMDVGMSHEEAWKQTLTCFVTMLGSLQNWLREAHLKNSDAEVRYWMLDYDLEPAQGIYREDKSGSEFWDWVLKMRKRFCPSMVPSIEHSM